MRREPSARNESIRARTAGLALAVAFAACVTDSVSVVPCENGLMCPPRTVCTPVAVLTDTGFATDYRCDPAGCGDGVLDPRSGEVCDHGTHDNCSADCRRWELCGDGKRDPDEACDPARDDECSNDCRSTLTCGDGVVNTEHGEACDEGIGGTARATGTCDDDCSIPVCGDGTTNPFFVNPATGRTEECDDGGMNTNMCNADCTLSRCGDGLHNMAAGEKCDGGGVDTPDCNKNCTLPECGDGHENKAAGEECEDDEDTDACNGRGAGSVACRVPFCGDGYHNEVAGEACDDGVGGVPRDSAICNQHCTIATCGDGYVNNVAGEICDDGGDTATCNGPGDAQCRRPTCGDGRVNTAAGEQCEPSEAPRTDESSDPPRTCNGSDAGAVACRWSICGDGHVDEDAGEECDDGNHLAFDACPSGSFPGQDHPPGLCQRARCGDGFIWLGVEACDTTVDTATCNGPEAGEFECQIPRCGDGHVNEAAGEECEGEPCINQQACLPPGDPNECHCDS